ncbi:helix-turn-helix domain-containing protein [Nonomuraea sp. NPDC026600]|uniref:helix-turn-helix domain-containing protein n=1 Tax=Nonomuraea sp. NPDC026600 TaxID=3155363 RepID=UPI0033C94D3B
MREESDLGSGGSNHLMSVKDVAAYMDVPESTVYACWKKWELPGYRIGKHLRFRVRNVETWIDSQVIH